MFFVVLLNTGINTGIPVFPKYNTEIPVFKFGPVLDALIYIYNYRKSITYIFIVLEKVLHIYL